MPVVVSRSKIPNSRSRSRSSTMVRAAAPDSAPCLQMISAVCRART
jgi:hypothetical protein